MTWLSSLVVYGNERLIILASEYKQLNCTGDEWSRWLDKTRDVRWVEMTHTLHAGMVKITISSKNVASEERMFLKMHILIFSFLR